MKNSKSKIPTKKMTNNQIPNSKQSQMTKCSNVQNKKSFGHWVIRILVIVWSLVIGYWLFFPSPVFAGELSNHFTVGLWVKPSGSVASKAILVKNNEIRLVTDSAGKPLCQIHNGTAWQTAATANSALTLNKWAHLACSYDKSSLVIYVNGVRQGSSSLSVAVNDTTNTFKVGKDDGGTYGDLSGFVDEVKIYNYARTQKQIIEDMNAGHPIGGSPVGSILTYYKFDEGYGTTANDSGTAGNNGLITNATWNNSGKIGKSLEFDDTSNTYVQSNSTVLLDSDQTFSVWIKPYNIVGLKGILATHDHATTSNLGINICNTGKIGISIGYTDGTREYCTKLSNYTLTANQWTYLALTYSLSSNTIKLYVNGNLDSQWSLSKTVKFTSNKILVGQWSNSYLNNYKFDGLIDEVKIYSAALTADQIKQDYNQGKAVVMGAVSTDSSGNPSWSSSREYCIPGDTSTCNPPVAEWKFDEKTGTTAYDTSGNGNNGTLTNMESTDWKSAGQCHEGACLDFDGSNETITVPDSGSSSLDLSSAGTLEIWAKSDRQYPSDSTNYYYRNFLSKSYGGGTSTVVYSFHWHGTNSLSELRFCISNGTSLNCQTYNIGPLTVEEWNHYAVTWDTSANTVKWYVNGVLKETDTNSISAQTTNSDFHVGGCTFGCGANQNWDGKLDHAIVYNYARTPAQIAWDYNRGKPVAWWKFDECQGTTAYDASGNGNNGTINIGASGTQTSAGTCTDGLSTSAWYNGATGKYNASLNFDGGDDYVSASSMDANTGRELTMSAWFKPNALGSYTFVGYGGVNDWVNLKANTTLQLWDDINNTNITVNGTTSLSTGNWYFAVLTIDTNGVKKLYLNGKLEASSSSTSTVASDIGVDTINMGRRNYATTPEYYSGQIDDVRVFNYALTEDQVKSLYNQGSAIRFGPEEGSP